MLFTFCVASGFAEEHFLTFRQIDGTERSLPLAGLSITFSEGQLSASSAGQSFALDLTTMQDMYFSGTPSGVQNIQEAAPVLPTIVYDLMGRRISTQAGGVNHGIYIIKDGEGARKEMQL